MQESVAPREHKPQTIRPRIGQVCAAVERGRLEETQDVVRGAICPYSCRNHRAHLSAICGLIVLPESRLDIALEAFVARSFDSRPSKHLMKHLFGHL